VANMYFIPIGLFIRDGAPDSFWAAIGKTAGDFPQLTWDRFLFGNLVPVTLGNIIGGALLVGAFYWFVYLRPTQSLVIRGKDDKNAQELVGANDILISK